MDILNRQQHKKPFREWLLNLCGYEIWPPTHNDPFVKGPQPRIVSKRQAAALRAMGETFRDCNGEHLSCAFRLGHPLYDAFDYGKKLLSVEMEENMENM